MKTNIGHLEGASGLAGIMKSIIILERGQIPPNALFEKLNTKIKAKLNNLKVRAARLAPAFQRIHGHCAVHKTKPEKFPTTCTPWPTAGLRRISVNCFGFGGSNSHIILDDAFHTLEALDIKAIRHVAASFSQSTPVNGPKPMNGLANNHDKDTVNDSFSSDQTMTTLGASNGTLNGLEVAHIALPTKDPSVSAQAR